MKGANNGEEGKGSGSSCAVIRSSPLFFVWYMGRRRAEPESDRGTESSDQYHPHTRAPSKQFGVSVEINSSNRFEEYWYVLFT